MLARWALLSDRILRRYTPDPFLIAVALTAVVWVLGWVLTPSSAGEMSYHWGTSFWSLIAFTLQMVMILVGGYILAASPPVQKLLTFVARQARTPGQAVVLTTLISCFAALLNWGLGLVVGAFLAREMARQVPQVKFRVLVASAYSGFLVWHAGLSGSIPLVVNTPGNFSEKWTGGLIPLAQTLFSPMNLVAVTGLLILLPVLNSWMNRHDSDDQEPQIQWQEVPPSVAAPVNIAPAEKWLHSPLASVALALLGIGFLGLQVSRGEFRLDLNQMNFLFLLAGLVLHRTPHSFLQATNEAATKVGPLLVQYPLYAGIMGMMTESGLAAKMSEAFVAVSNAQTFAPLGFLSAGLVNLFVPSGGGQWAVQAPIVMPAAQQLGVDPGLAAMAIAWGDAWTNMAQPFWALPLLAIAGLSARDIMSYCLTVLIVSGAWLVSVLYLFS